MNPWTLHNFFHKKNYFDKLNPYKYGDAKKIVKTYEQHKPPYDNDYYCKGVIFRKVIIAQNTILLN